MLVTKLRNAQQQSHSDDKHYKDGMIIFFLLVLIMYMLVILGKLVQLQWLLHNYFLLELNTKLLCN